MKIIPLPAALDLLDAAYAIDVHDGVHGWLKSSFALHTDDDGEDEFLRLEAANDEGLMWEFKFLRSENKNAVINGDVMTLVACMAVHDDVEPKVDIRILVPAHLEVREVPPEADELQEAIDEIEDVLDELLADSYQLKPPFRNEAICERAEAALKAYRLARSVRDAAAHTGFEAVPPKKEVISTAAPAEALTVTMWSPGFRPESRKPVVAFALLWTPVEGNKDFSDPGNWIYEAMFEGMAVACGYSESGPVAWAGDKDTDTWVDSVACDGTFASGARRALELAADNAVRQSFDRDAREIVIPPIAPITTQSPTS